MKILITGSSSGIGRAVSLHFLSLGYEVIGFDLKESAINDSKYTHYILDIKNKELLPEIEGLDYIFNNAGLFEADDLIENNLIGTINITEKYGFSKNIKSILFNASASSRTGDEFPMYVASKAGIIGYMRNVAMRLATSKATSNSISFGGVLTDSNKMITDDPKLWDEVMKVTPLKKWVTLEEACEWVYFLLVINKSMSGEDVYIDNGEHTLHSTFVWPK